MLDLVRTNLTNPCLLGKIKERQLILVATENKPLDTSKDLCLNFVPDENLEKSKKLPR